MTCAVSTQEGVKKFAKADLILHYEIVHVRGL